MLKLSFLQRIWVNYYHASLLLYNTTYAKYKKQTCIIKLVKTIVIKLAIWELGNSIEMLSFSPLQIYVSHEVKLNIYIKNNEV